MTRRRESSLIDTYDWLEKEAREATEYRARPLRRALRNIGKDCGTLLAEKDGIDLTTRFTQPDNPGLTWVPCSFGLGYKINRYPGRTWVCKVRYSSTPEGTDYTTNVHRGQCVNGYSPQLKFGGLWMPLNKNGKRIELTR